MNKKQRIGLDLFVFGIMGFYHSGIELNYLYLFVELPGLVMFFSE